MKNNFTLLLPFIFAISVVSSVCSQGHTDRKLPENWKNLTKNARFIDRFSPIPIKDKLVSNVWGAEGIIPRDTLNGIEDKDWSYWGGNILKDASGVFHLYTCRWPEDAIKGFRGWKKSIIVHATSSSYSGPFKVVETIGKGHNPEAFKLKDGRIVIGYFENGVSYPERFKYFISNSYFGPFEKNQMFFEQNGRKKDDNCSNMSFITREDGAVLAVSRVGNIWLSKTGTSPFVRISENSVYPKYEGAYEDPVIWKTNIQYHMIVHDWKGRVAYHLRSKNGLNWKVDPGQAYNHKISVYENNKREQWYKYERIKVYQDEYGRALQANFGVLDVPKSNDLSNDNHGTKNLCIPLEKGRLIEVVSKGNLKKCLKEIKLEIKAEDDFNPITDIDYESLRFGAPEKVDFGKGCKPVRFETKGNNLIVIFSVEGHGFTSDNFTGKLLGMRKNKSFLFGYSKLPWVDYNDGILTVGKPSFVISGNKMDVIIPVENIGLSKSEKTKVTLYVNKGVNQMTKKVCGLEPYGKEYIKFKNVPYHKSNKYIQVKTELMEEKMTLQIPEK